MLFSFKKIDHVQLAASKGSENIARKYFTDILGFEEVQKPETLKKRGGFWFLFGVNQLHIGIEEPFSPAKKAHTAFEVENIEELKIHLANNERLSPKKVRSSNYIQYMVNIMVLTNTIYCAYEAFFVRSRPFWELTMKLSIF